MEEECTHFRFANQVVSVSGLWWESGSAVIPVGLKTHLYTTSPFGRTNNLLIYYWIIILNISEVMI